MVTRIANQRRKNADETNERANSHLREQAAIVGRDVRELAATAGAAAREQMDPLAAYVREKPVKAMLIAAGVGALVSLIFLRR